jgi:hypothetical protein
MRQRFLSAVAVMLIMVMSNAAAAQTRSDIAANAFAWYPSWSYQPPNRCIVWDGYQWVDLCWRPRAFFRPAWSLFRR